MSRGDGGAEVGEVDRLLDPLLLEETAETHQILAPVEVGVDEPPVGLLPREQVGVAERVRMRFHRGNRTRAYGEREQENPGAGGHAALVRERKAGCSADG